MIPILLCICVWYTHYAGRQCVWSFVKCERRWGDDRSCREVELNSIIYRHTPPRHSDKYISGFGEILWTLLMRSYQINNQLHLTTYIYIEPCRELFFEGRGYEIGNTHARDGIFLYYSKVHVFSVWESKSLFRQMCSKGWLAIAKLKPLSLFISLF